MSTATDQRYKLIVRNLQEILGDDDLKNLLASGKEVSILWGTAPTDRPHVGYLLPAAKIADFLNAGCKVVVLFADVHSFLDDPCVEWNSVKFRVRYYKTVIKALIQGFGAPLEKLQFVRGSDFQLSKSYVLDILKMSKVATVHDAEKAGSEVIKTSKHPKLAGLLYPCLQALDEEHLQIDCQFGGLDQRKVFTFTEKYLPSTGGKKGIHLMSPMVQGLSGSKMSSSQETSKINFTDDVQTVEAKIKKAFCEPGNVERNGVLSIAKHIIFPSLTGNFELQKNHEGNGKSFFRNYDEVERAFGEKALHPKDLKDAVCRELNRVLDPIRKALDAVQFDTLTRLAYTQDE